MIKLELKLELKVVLTPVHVPPYVVVKEDKGIEPLPALYGPDHTYILVGDDAVKDVIFVVEHTSTTEPFAILAPVGPV